MTGIAMKESSYMQFNKIILYGRDDKWPVESPPVTGYPKGSFIGLMQVPVSMQTAWD